ncbi:MAG: RES domain-containing protein [Bryobacteraceae bacterium]
MIVRICKAAFPANDGEVNSALHPADRVIIEAHIPPRVPMEEIDIASLPPDWKSPVPTNSTKDIGTDWAKRMDTAVLSVPSAVVDRERNFLLNPLHRDFQLIKFDPPEAFDFDPRLK